MTTFDGWENELYHHGIKGQKWGIRRFQNPDGTLTEAGRKRRNDELRKETDTRRLKGKEKLQKEQSIMRAWYADQITDKNEKDFDLSAQLVDRIEKESGNYYESKPVSKGFEKKYNEIKQARNELKNVREQLIEKNVGKDPYKDLFKSGKSLDDLSYSEYAKISNAHRKYLKKEMAYKVYEEPAYKEQKAKIDRLYDELSGVVLKDIGYEDTAKSRKLVAGLIRYN